VLRSKRDSQYAGSVGVGALFRRRLRLADLAAFARKAIAVFACLGRFINASLRATKTLELRRAALQVFVLHETLFVIRHSFPAPP